MNTDDFEKKLRRQPLQQIPADWRQAILRTAQDRVSSAVRPAKPVLVRSLLVAWRELIQPCRYAWSVMAALWLIFWGINSRTEFSDSPKPTTASNEVASERIRSFAEQRRVLAELTGAADLSPTESSRRAHPKRRSERKLESRNC